MSTIFSKIIKKEIPAYIVYEDELVLAFLDISQVTIGHTLVIPKKEYTNVFMLPDNVSSRIFSVAVKLSNAIKTAFSPKGLNILTNNGAIAGQSVFHFHLHLIPRYTPGDIDALFKAENKPLSNEEYLKRAQMIKAALL